MNENLVSLNIVPWYWRNEPLGQLIFLCTLGYAAAQHFFSNEKRLLAIENEMEIARQIQSSILPRKMPTVPGLDIAGRYVPMASVAGDFYDVLTIDDKRLSILVADVSGHGVGAALLASMLKVAFASQASHAFDPARVLAGMNQTLCGKLESNFVTAGCLFIDTEKRTMQYAGAGHPPLLLWRKTERKMQELGANGIILGPFPDAKYSNTCLNFEAGDRILLCTDGILEATDSSGNFFGDDRFKDFIKAHDHLAAERFADTLLQHLFTWSGKRSTGALDDHLTLIVVDIFR